MTTDHEIVLAEKIQQSILPKDAPYLEGYEISAYMKPAKVVAGDFYGYIPLLSGPKTIGLYVGDVVDKGIPAALYMMLANGILRAGLSLTKEMSPEDTLLWLNLQLLQLMPDIEDDANHHNMNLTMVYGILDAQKHEFSYARAGHEIPYLIDSSGTFLHNENGIGQPLGFLTAPLLDTSTLNIPPGGILVLHTDGIKDETNFKNQFFGNKRLEDLLVQNRSKSATEICSVVNQELISYRDNTSQHDDYTLMIIKRKY